jgi:hypothetical protein
MDEKLLYIYYICWQKVTHIRIYLNLHKTILDTKQKKNSVALSPRANYTDWVITTCRRNLVPTFVDRGVSRGQRGWSPMVVNLSFLDRLSWICQFKIFITYNFKTAWSYTFLLEWQNKIAYKPANMYAHCITHESVSTKKRKTIPVVCSGGLQGCELSRFPHLLNSLLKNGN